MEPTTPRSPETDADYFARRSQEESAAAQACSDPAAAKVHLTLADLYRRHADTLREARVTEPA